MGRKKKNNSAQVKNEDVSENVLEQEANNDDQISSAADTTVPVVGSKEELQGADGQVEVVPQPTLDQSNGMESFPAEGGDTITDHVPVVEPLGEGTDDLDEKTTDDDDAVLDNNNDDTREEADIPHTLNEEVEVRPDTHEIVDARSEHDDVTNVMSGVDGDSPIKEETCNDDIVGQTEEDVARSDGGSRQDDAVVSNPQHDVVVAASDNTIVDTSDSQEANEGSGEGAADGLQHSDDVAQDVNAMAETQQEEVEGCERTEDDDRAATGDALSSSSGGVGVHMEEDGSTAPKEEERSIVEENCEEQQSGGSNDAADHRDDDDQNEDSQPCPAAEHTRDEDGDDEQQHQPQVDEYGVVFDPSTYRSSLQYETVGEDIFTRPAEVTVKNYDDDIAAAARLARQAQEAVEKVSEETVIMVVDKFNDAISSVEARIPHIVSEALQEQKTEFGQQIVAESMLPVAMGMVKDHGEKMKSEYQMYVRDETEMVRSDLRSNLNDAVGAVENQVADFAAKLWKKMNSVESQSAADTLESKAEFSKVLQKMEALHEQQEQLAARIEAALRIEKLPPPRPIPDGPKIRLTITVPLECTGSTKDVMVPISKNALISDLKHEILRRSRGQNLIGAGTVYSNTIISLDGQSLYEDDSLDDVGICGGEKLVVELTSTPERQAPPPLASAVQHSNHVAPQEHNSVANTHAGVPSFSPSDSTHNNKEPPILSFDREKVGISTVHRSLVDLVLPREAAAEHSEVESLERRLCTELERMEREPLKRREHLERIGLIKEGLERTRIKLIDRATYCPNDAHRSAARCALDQLDSATNAPSLSLDVLEVARKVAEGVLSEIGSTDGETLRVSAVEDSMKVESHRKSKCINDMKDTIFDMRYRHRISAEMMPRAENLIDEAETALIMAPSMSMKDLDNICQRLFEFVGSIKK